MENKRITVEELSVLMWLKLLDDFELITDEGEVIESLSEKMVRFDTKSDKDAPIKTQFFYDAFNKLEELGLVTDLSLSDLGTKIASTLLAMKKAKITVTTSFKDIVKFVKDNREEISIVLEKIAEIGICIGKIIKG